MVPSGRSGPSPLPWRWIALFSGILAQVSMSSLQQGLPVLGPFLLDAFELTLPELGILLAASSWGALGTLFVWGRLADLLGERPVVVAGLAGAILALLLATASANALQLGLCLALAGAMASSTIAASGRAVLGWFPRGQRGFALGIRQMAVPLGSTLAAITLPIAVIHFGWPSAFLVLALFSVVGGIAALVGLRPAPPLAPASGAAAPPPVASPVKDRAIWLLSSACGTMLWAQAALNAFLVVMLVEFHGLSATTAALVFALLQIASGIIRIVVGRLSDRTGRRLPHLRLAGTVLTASLFVAAAFNVTPSLLGVAVLIFATLMSYSWNGLAFTAVAELAAPGRAGTALGMHGTMMRLLTVPTTLAFGIAAAQLGWAAALVLLGVFPLVAVIALAPIQREELRRVAFETGAANRTRPARAPAPDG